MSFTCPPLLQGYCEPVFAYSERGSEVGLWAEPLNAITNSAFLVAAVMLWLLQNRVQNESVAVSSRLLAILIAIIGLGSALFHTVANQWTLWADVLPILFFLLFYCWLGMSLLLGWNWITKFLVVLVYLTTTFIIEYQGPALAEKLIPYLDGDVQLATTLSGGAFYLPTILLLLVFGTLLVFRHARVGLAFYLATFLFLFSYALRSLDGVIENVLPDWTHGTHFFWHIFNATVLYLLVRILIKYAPLAGRQTKFANRAVEPGS